MRQSRAKKNKISWEELKRNGRMKLDYCSYHQIFLAGCKKIKITILVKF